MNERGRSFVLTFVGGEHCHDLPLVALFLSQSAISVVTHPITPPPTSLVIGPFESRAGGSEYVKCRESPKSSLPYIVSYINSLACSLLPEYTWISDQQHHLLGNLCLCGLYCCECQPWNLYSGPLWRRSQKQGSVCKNSFVIPQ